MKRIRYIIFTLSTVLTFSLIAATHADAQRYSGRATAIQTTVGIPATNPVTTAVNDTGELPPAGGAITLANAGASIGSPPFLTAGASSSMTRGGTPVGTSHSETNVASVNFTVLGNAISATGVATQTDCSCPDSCTGSTTITSLTINSVAIVISGSANQTINLFGPLGQIVGTLVINEQTPGIRSITVNGIHARVTDSLTGIVTDVVVASSHSDILCTVLPNFTFFSGRAFGIGSTVRTDTISPVGSSTVATLVADTGPLPSSGGSIGPVVVAGANIPVASSGTLTSSTSGGASGGIYVSDSSSSVQNLVATVAGFTITATVLSSQTHCECALATTVSTCTGGSVVTALNIATPAGGNVFGSITGAPNNTIQLRIGSTVVATLIINEQIPVSPTSSGSITVNALHIITTTSVPGVSTSQTDTIIASSHSDINCGTLGPTAAAVDISGRVMSGKRAVSRARVTLSSPSGDTFSSLTNGLGYFTITEVPAGLTYFVDISARGYSFETQTLLVTDELSGLIFMLE